MVTLYINGHFYMRMPRDQFETEWELSRPMREAIKSFIDKKVEETRPASTANVELR